MESVKSYILRVIAAAMFSAVILSLIGKSSGFHKLLKLMCGVLMTLVLVSPLIKAKISLPVRYMEVLSDEADAIAANAQMDAQRQLCDIIKERTEAYIVEKARQLNSEITASVALEMDKDYPVPKSVHLEGNISPYARKRLSQTIQDDLGIASEDQTWSS